MYFCGITYYLSESIRKMARTFGIEFVFRRTNQLRTKLGKKSEEPRLNAAVVYCIPCSCGKVYIGQTYRPLKERLTEHKRNVRLGRPKTSALVQHADNHPDHVVAFENTNVLARERNNKLRLIKEALLIRAYGNRCYSTSSISTSIPYRFA
jgi:predicted GIY-YIG superfamily endonuclease